MLLQVDFVTNTNNIIFSGAQERLKRETFAKLHGNGPARKSQCKLIKSTKIQPEYRYIFIAALPYFYKITTLSILQSRLNMNVRLKRWNYAKWHKLQLNLFLWPKFCYVSNVLCTMYNYDENLVQNIYFINIKKKYKNLFEEACQNKYYVMNGA